MLVAVAIAALAVLAVAVALVRRRRTARGASLSLGTTRRRPAGVSHLATGVSELSDLGLHLRASSAPRRRLGELLGWSSGASR
jgi:hypothetical protein